MGLGQGRLFPLIFLCPLVALVVSSYPRFTHQGIPCHVMYFFYSMSHTDAAKRMSPWPQANWYYYSSFHFHACGWVAHILTGAECKQRLVDGSARKNDYGSRPVPLSSDWEKLYSIQFWISVSSKIDLLLSWLQNIVCLSTGITFNWPKHYIAVDYWFFFHFSPPLAKIFPILVVHLVRLNLPFFSQSFEFCDDFIFEVSFVKCYITYNHQRHMQKAVRAVFPQPKKLVWYHLAWRGASSTYV